MEQLNRNLATAIDDGVTSLSQLDSNNCLKISMDAAVKSFFLSLYSSFGVISDKENQEKLNAYIPVITFTMEDGFYIFYSEDFTGVDGYTYVAKTWSEKFPYYYEDEDFIYGFSLGNVISLYDKNGLLSGAERSVFKLDYHDIQTKSEYASFRNLRPESILLNDESFELVRKGTIISCIEVSMAYYTSHHNKIAQRYGITYNFSLPVIRDDEWAPFLDDISMFVVFQGYPYGNEASETYNRFLSAGAKVSKNKVYYIEQKDWYYIYHRSDCPELRQEGIIFDDTPYYTIKDCVEKGAYACEHCCKNRKHVYAPDIS
ncbi:hypothetical protein [Mobilitalea sibirica]|nr:hypothetical protein [Mobilitalea sibirica]